jgi:PAS domain S-box-containing protein
MLPGGLKLGGWLEGGAAVLDHAGRVEDANEELSSWLELTPAQVVGLPFWEALGTAEPLWLEPLAKFRAADEQFARLSLPASGASAASHWFSLEIARSRSGSYVRLNSALPPLSELQEAAWDEHLGGGSAQREMYLRLVRAEAQLEGLLRRSPCVLISQRPDFSLDFASPNIQELTGVSPADWSGQSRRFWELVHESDAGELRLQIRRAVETGADVASNYRIRHALTGRVAHILEHRHPVRSRGGLLLGYEVMWQDTTRRTVAEKRLSAAAWKETLAVLTLGMAHDFRNIMAGIHSLSESYLAQVEAESPFREGLSLIKQNSLQASELIQRMISLHLGQAGERNYHDLNEIASDLAGLMSRIVKRRIKVAAELAPGQLPVHVDLVELRQVVINLMLNAADAMSDGGNLTLHTSRHETLPPLLHMKGVAPRLPCVCLAIQDTGAGIKERHLASIFDPFFTTKAKGSGLGLYNAQIGVEKHQGAISVESEEGMGTSFKIWLPQADFSESSQNPAAAGQQARLTLLLLGQTGELIDQTAEFLRVNNYHVVLATAAGSIEELLHSEDYVFSGAIVLIEPNDNSLASFLTEVRRQNANLKIALKLAGRNQDDLGSQLLDGVDLVLNSDLAESDTLSKLQSMLK